MLTRDKVSCLILLFIVVFQAQAAKISCPTGYIPVPGNNELSTKDFCVAKYEMRKSSSDTAVPIPQGMAWHNIKPTDAFNQCKAISQPGYSGKFQLMTNPQWMTLARNIENTASNWSGAVVGNGHINRGWTANIPNTPSDPFSNTQRAPHSESSCEYNTGVNACGTSGAHKFKRTFNLSNGEQLWDVAGNVGEWIDWKGSDNTYSTAPSVSTPAWQLANNAVSPLTINDVGAKGNFTHTHNMGRWYGGGGSAVVRGGYESHGDYAGIYQMDMTWSQSAQSAHVGFRCVYKPADENRAPAAKADNFGLKDRDGSVELNILANDTDEDKTSLVVTITNQSALGGSATVSGQKLSYTPKEGYAGEDWVEYRLTDKQGLTSEVVRVMLNLTTTVPPKNVNCPTGYIPVPGNNELDTKDFCVAKFEMRKSSSDTATSIPQGMAWHSITPVDAFNHCKAVTESGYNGTFNLITNPQWMTLARNIENTGYNWSSRSVGTGHINRGWTANIPNTPSDTFTNTQRAPHSENSCEYNTNVNTCGTSGEHRYKRIFYLNNGQQLWDIAGNVGEWVDWVDSDNTYSTPPSVSASAWQLANKSVAPLTINDVGVRGNFTHAQNMGRWYGGSGSAVVRGGYESHGDYAGIYQMDMSWKQSTKSAYVGFRCTYKLADDESITNLAPVARADSYNILNNSPTEFRVMDNDRDNDKASVVINITGKKADGGNITVEGQKVKYQPQIGFIGQDWFDYRLKNKDGLLSDVVRVTITLRHPQLKPPTISPNYSWVYQFEEPLTVTISTDEPGANIEYHFQTKNANGQVITSSPKVYTQPIVLKEWTRVWAKTTRAGYPTSQSQVNEYIFCSQTSRCPADPSTPSEKKELRWASNVVKVGQRANLHWWFTRVGKCYEKSSGQTERSYTPQGDLSNSNKGHDQRRFTTTGKKTSQWYCVNPFVAENVFKQKVLPTNGGTMDIHIDVEKLDAPVRDTNQEDLTKGKLAWKAVPHAAQYLVRYQVKNSGNWKQITTNQTNITLVLNGENHFEISACIPETCDNVGEKLVIIETALRQESLSWNKTSVIIGQTVTLSWHIRNAQSCGIKGMAKKSGSQGAQEITYYTSGTQNTELECTGADGLQIFTLPQDKRLKVNKLAAPSNLRKQ